MQYIYIKILHLIWHIFRHKSEFILHESKTAYHNLSIKFQPEINFLGMFSDDKFMAGYNTKTHIPWNSPYFLSDFYVNDPKNILFLGGGPCYTVKLVWDKFKSSMIEIVEHDIQTIKLAHKFFSLPKNNRIKITIQNAEDFIKNDHKKYDIIFYDLGFSYERKSDEIYSLGSKQSTFKRLKKLLSKKGIIIFVVISKRSGKEKIFINQLMNKMKKHFSNVDFYCDLPKQPKLTQSNIFILSNYKFDILKSVKKLIILKTNWGKMYSELWNKKVVKFP